MTWGSVYYCFVRGYHVYPGVGTGVSAGATIIATYCRDCGAAATVSDAGSKS